MKKIILLLFIGLLQVNGVLSQFTDYQIREFVKTASMKDLVMRNSTLLMDGYYYQSTIVAEKLLEMEPDNANFNYRMGFALFNFNSDHNLAKPYLNKATANVSKIYDNFSHNEKRAPIDSYFYLGRCFHLNKEIKEAREYYNTFLDKVGSESELIPQTKLLLKQCDVAEDFLQTPKKYEVINLGEQINTDDPEYAPVISLDGTSLYFTTRRLRQDSSNMDIKEPMTNMYLEDIYVSTKDENGVWQQAVLLDDICLPERNDASVAISPDERRIYIYRDDVGNGDIFYSDFDDNRFQDVVPVDIDGINTDAWEPHICVSADGNAKYFVSDREGGFGGRDIYRVVKLPNGEWSQPQNLGPKINSEYDEDSPFIAVDNKTLYFASNGEQSMGGFDIFVSVMDEDGQWSEPINLGYPLNSMGDDIYYNTTADGYTGYLSSFRPGGQGEKDIYEIRNDYMSLDNVVVLKGKISVIEGQELPEDVAFRLKCTNCADNLDRITRPRIPDGTFLTSLTPCRDFEIEFFHGEGENRNVFHLEKLNTQCDRGYCEIIRNFLLDVDQMKFVDEAPEPDPEPIVFNPIKLEHYFGYNKNKLTPEKGALNEFLTKISDQISAGRDEVTIYVESSASRVPTSTYNNNENLARVRANNIKQTIEDYVAQNEVLKGKVKVEIKKTGVNGPAYNPGELNNLAKYGPFQYIKLNVDGVDSTEDAKTLQSKDDELKGKF